MGRSPIATRDRQRRARAGAGARCHPRRARRGRPVYRERRDAARRRRRLLAGDRRARRRPPPPRARRGLLPGWPRRLLRRRDLADRRGRRHGHRHRLRRGPAALRGLDGAPDPLVRPADCVVIGNRFSRRRRPPTSATRTPADPADPGPAAPARRRRRDRRRRRRAARAQAGAIWLHIDCDVLDEQVMAAVTYRSPAARAGTNSKRSCAGSRAGPSSSGSRSPNSSREGTGGELATRLAGLVEAVAARSDEPCTGARWPTPLLLRSATGVDDVIAILLALAEPEVEADRAPYGTLETCSLANHGCGTRPAVLALVGRGERARGGLRLLAGSSCARDRDAARRARC